MMMPMINGWWGKRKENSSEKKKETTFVGFEDVEQYHSLSQKIVVELGDLLQEKIMELGK